MADRFGDRQGVGARLEPGRTSVAKALAAPHPWLWFAAALIAILDAVWISALGIHLQPLGFALVGAAVLILLGLAALWSIVYPEPTLRGMALATAFLLAFTTAVAVLHILAATIDRPLWDHQLAVVEGALRFDWRAFVSVMDAHPTLSRSLALAYHSSGPQVGLVVIVLAATKRIGRLWWFVRLFAATLLIVIVVSALYPAVGPYAFYMGLDREMPSIELVGATWHLERMAGLRSGAVTTLALSDIRGLATFPSFHACLALITAWALAPIRVLGILAVLVNGAIVVATIGAGGHYLPDVLAGLLIGAAAIAAPSLVRGRARGRLRAGFSPEPEAVLHSAAIGAGAAGARIRPG